MYRLFLKSDFGKIYCQLDIKLVFRPALQLPTLLKTTFIPKTKQPPTQICCHMYFQHTITYIIKFERKTTAITSSINMVSRQFKVVLGLAFEFDFDFPKFPTLNCRTNHEYTSSPIDHKAKLYQIFQIEIKIIGLIHSVAL